jgi:hypothetical protein
MFTRAGGLRLFFRRLRERGQSPHRGRVTILESRKFNFYIAPLLADVLALPYFDGTQAASEGVSALRIPDRCVISRKHGYTLDPKYDGLMIDVDKVYNSSSATENQGEKIECLRVVMQEIVRLRQQSLDY